MRTTRLALIVPVLCLAALAQSGKVETVGPLSASGVSAKITEALDSQGQRLKLADGSSLCDIWLRKNVSAPAGKNNGDVLYPQFSESLLIAVVTFAQDATDFRGQPITQGTYTLRYALMPDDGNHLGVAPNRDFLLLVKAGDDPDPATVFKFGELVGLSRHATGSNHPGVLSLTSPEKTAPPALTKDSEDHWIFSGVLKMDSVKDLPFSLIVKGTAPQ